MRRNRSSLKGWVNLGLNFEGQSYEEYGLWVEGLRLPPTSILH